MPSWTPQVTPTIVVERGQTFSSNVGFIPDNADEIITFNVLAGNTPIPVNLSVSANVLTLSGTTLVNTTPGNYFFTVRASGNEISDKSFEMTVEDIEYSNVLPNSNLGIFPTGRWANVSVAPVVQVDDMVGNISITAGSLPANLYMNSNGVITGYVSPTNLYVPNTSNPNMEVGAPSIPTSSNSATYNFTVEYNANASANYSMIVERQDIFDHGTANGNICYHTPIFLSATYPDTNKDNGNAFIDIGVIPADTITYQFITEDLEGDTLQYSVNTASNFPLSLSINSNTGWLTGTWDKTQSQNTPNYFTVTASKVVDANLTTTANCSITVQNPALNAIVWNTDTNLGTINSDVPSSLAISASIQYPFPVPTIKTAVANATMKLVAVTIVDGGEAFSIGDTLTIPGGVFNSPAVITVANVSASGSINEITIGNNIQQYSQLPLLSTLWENIDANTTSRNALLNLRFGVDTVNIIDTGGFYDTASVGFGYTGETSSAKGYAIIKDGFVESVTVTDSGIDYIGVPTVSIPGKSYVTPINPIRYALASGSLPEGLFLQSDGLIVGVPTARSAGSYTFQVSAAIGQNTSVDSHNSDYQTIITYIETFTLVIESTTTNPKTNLSLEFLLTDDDYDFLYTPLNDENIIPNNIIYRPTDYNFGIQTQPRLLMGYGLSVTSTDRIQQVIEQYHHDKTFIFDNVQCATSTSQGYDVLYIQPLDIFSTSDGRTWDGVIKSNGNVYYPASTSNMLMQLRNRLSAFDSNVLPTWMTDLQSDGSFIGYVPVIPLAYVKQGYGKRVQYYLNTYYSNNGKLTSMSPKVDRYVWRQGYSVNYTYTPITIIKGNSNVSVSANSTFIVNVSTPETVAANGMPTTWNYSGNVTINIINGGANIANIVNEINVDTPEGLMASEDVTGNIQLISTYGSPFILYDGTHTPLSSLGITIGTISNTVTGWYGAVIPTVDNVITTETSIDIVTEVGIDLSTEEETTTENFDTENDQYIIFPRSYFANVAYTEM